MTKLVFYGGVNEIGGNKILLSDSGTQVLLDFGLSFGMKDKYYDQFLGPRGFAIIDEYVAFGFLPAIKGIYREDHLKHINPSHSLLGNKSVDAVLISHAHLDHVGMIPFLKPDIRLIGSETTESIMQYLQDTMTGDEQEFCSWSPSFRMVPAKNGGGMKKAKSNDVIDEKVKRPFIRIKRKQVHQERNLEVTAYHVDHSLPGANGYILNTSSGVVAYTGDLRFHGHFSDESKEFVNALEKSDVHVLLCEGTRVDEAKGLTEETLEAKMTKSIENVRGLVLVNYPQRDASRIATLSRAAAACGRKLLVNPKQAYYLWKLSSSKDLPTIDSKNIEVLLPRKSWGIWGNSNYESKIQLQDYSYSYPKSVSDYIFNHSVLVTPQEVSAAQNEYIVTCTFYELNLLHDLQPKAGSQFIWSASEPFDEEGEIEYDRVRNWLNFFGLGEPVMMHCSGHLSGPEVKELIERSHPDIVVPIHTDHPTLFKNWHKDVRILERNAVLEI